MNQRSSRSHTIFRMVRSNVHEHVGFCGFLMALFVFAFLRFSKVVKGVTLLLEKMLMEPSLCLI